MPSHDAPPTAPELADRGRRIREPASRPGLASLLRVALAAVRFRPPLYLQSVFGPAATWLARHRPRSELTIVDPRRPRRALGFLARVLVPSVDSRAPSWATRWLPAALRDLFWRPTGIFRFPAAGGMDDFAGERWYFVNGVTTDRAVAELNAGELAEIFGRPLHVVHNSTNSLPLDLWECAIGKEFKDDPDLEVPESFTEPCLVATVEILAAVNDAAVSKVVVIAHSQGTIIVANALRAIARVLAAEERGAGGGRGAAAAVSRVAARLSRILPSRLDRIRRRFETALRDLAAAGRPLGRLEKLEIYTFANCADVMQHVSVRGDRPVPWLEHFANRRDLVARLGVLSPLLGEPGTIEIDGPVYVRPDGWGHLLNEHYLFTIGDHLAAKAVDPAAESPYRPRPGDPPEPRLFGYAGGGRPARPW